MKSQNLFREIDALLSYTEAKQREASESAFSKIKAAESKTINIRSADIQGWLNARSESAFKLARTVNRKIEEFSGEYIEFFKPVSVGSYAPVGIDIDDI